MGNYFGSHHHLQWCVWFALDCGCFSCKTFTVSKIADFYSSLHVIFHASLPYGYVAFPFSFIFVETIMASTENVVDGSVALLC